MFKYLLLLVPLLTFGSVSITSSVISDGYLYDLDVQFDFNKYVSAYEFLGGEHTLGLEDNGQKIWYETMTFKPSQDGWYTFDNYDSDIAVGNTIIEETQLLFYTDEPDDYIIDVPSAFRDNNNYGWGLGNGEAGNWPEGEVTPQGFYAEMELTGGTEYIVLFTSFVPDAYGTLDVSIIGNDPAAFGVVPEPTSFALLMAFGTFLFVAIRQRNK
jgi:hypothetical protein